MITDAARHLQAATTVCSLSYISLFSPSLSIQPCHDSPPCCVYRLLFAMLLSAASLCSPRRMRKSRRCWTTPKCSGQSSRLLQQHTPTTLQAHTSSPCTRLSSNLSLKTTCRCSSMCMVRLQGSRPRARWWHQRALRRAARHVADTDTQASADCLTSMWTMCLHALTRWTRPLLVLAWLDSCLYRFLRVYMSFFASLSSLAVLFVLYLLLCLGQLTSCCQGENSVMSLQCARFLLKMHSRATSGQHVPAPMAYLKNTTPAPFIGDQAAWARAGVIDAMLETAARTYVTCMRALH